MFKHADFAAEVITWGIVGIVGAIILYHGGIWAVLAWALTTLDSSLRKQRA